jgi:cardiolipin synthase
VVAGAIDQASGSAHGRGTASERLDAGNEVVLLQSGAEYFPSLVDAIAAATAEVRLETYIFADDTTGLRVAGALARAAERGVAVRVMVDGYGTRTLPSGIARRMEAAGVELRVYAPVRRLLSFDRERLRRMHRKQACIDRRVAFVGGINVLDDHVDPNHGPLDHPRLDYAVRLRGPLVGAVHAAMSRLWRQVPPERRPLFGGRPVTVAVPPSSRAVRVGEAEAAEPGGSGAGQGGPGGPAVGAVAPDETQPGAAGAPAVSVAAGTAGEPVAPVAAVAAVASATPAATAATATAATAGPAVATPAADALVARAMLVLRDNLVHRRAIERAYLKAIGGSRREVLIATAYFFPGRRFRRALREAASRGVRVRLLLQGRPEYVLPHLAAQSMYGPLMRAGVEIVEYHRSFLHAKVAVIDDWATVGSSNIDPFSLLLAQEANVMVFDAAFAARLRTRLLDSMVEGGRPVRVEDTEGQPWMRRLQGWFAWRMLRLGVRLSGARHRY